MCCYIVANIKESMHSAVSFVPRFIFKFRETVTILNGIKSNENDIIIINVNDKYYIIYVYETNQILC